jgi:hypothetical protein
MSELLEAAAIAHGRLDRWNPARSVDVTFNFSGAAASTWASADRACSRKAWPAAVVRLPVSATATKYRRCRSSIPLIHAQQVCPLTYKVLPKSARPTHLPAHRHRWRI